MFERTNFLTCATGLQGTVQMLKYCLQESVQIFALNFFRFYQGASQGSRIVLCTLYKKTCTVQLLTRVRVEVQPYR